jgi:hypothetical protein
MNKTLFGIKEAWENNKRPVLVVVIFISLLVFIGCCVYWYHFPSFGFSHDSKGWADFSVYITAIISFLNLIVFAILSYLLYRYNGRNDNQKSYESAMREKPIIIFSYTKLDGCYSIQNIGAGAALNIHVRKNFKDGSWQEGYLWNSLPSKSELQKMKWSTQTHVLCATYFDIFENQYYSYMESDYLTIINCYAKGSIEKHQEIYNKCETKLLKMDWRPE